MSYYAPWEPEHESALAGFMAEGLSFAESAAAINCKFGTHYSRSSAIGKAFRIGLACAENAKSPPRLSVEAIQLRCVEITPRHVLLLDLKPNDCRYPYGDRDITFCGHPKQEGFSYCTPHRFLTSRPRP